MANASLKHRKDVLKHHFKTTIANKAWPNQWLLAWRQAIEMCIAGSARDPAQFLLIFLTCSNDPQSLWRQSFADPSQSPVEALKGLKSAPKSTSELEAAIIQIEQLISSDMPDLCSSVANNVNGRKRKTSQSLKKRKKRHLKMQEPVRV